MPRLILPGVKYQKSFFEDFLDYQGKPAIEWDSWGQYYNNKKLIKKDFAGFVRLLKSQAKGQNLPPRYIEQTIYWLVDQNKFIGILSLRHKLTKYLRTIGGHIGYEIARKFQGQGYGNLILKLGLKKAKKFGIKDVLLTCDTTNIRSKKIIEANGGRFASKVKQSGGLPLKLRFWIKT